jgi:streptogramin lyase
LLADPRLDTRRIGEPTDETDATADTSKEIGQPRKAEHAVAESIYSPAEMLWEPLDLPQSQAPLDAESTRIGGRFGSAESAAGISGQMRPSCRNFAHRYPLKAKMCDGVVKMLGLSGAIEKYADRAGALSLSSRL